MEKQYTRIRKCNNVHGNCFGFVASFIMFMFLCLNIPVTCVKRIRWIRELFNQSNCLTNLPLLWMNITAIHPILFRIRSLFLIIPCPIVTTTECNNFCCVCCQLGSSCGVSNFLIWGYTKLHDTYEDRKIKGGNLVFILLNYCIYCAGAWRCTYILFDPPW